METPTQQADRVREVQKAALIESAAFDPASVVGAMA